MLTVAVAEPVADDDEPMEEVDGIIVEASASPFAAITMVDEGAEPPDPSAAGKGGGPAPGQCERNPLCVRGFRHGGKGGHCSLRKEPKPSKAAAAAGLVPGQCERSPLCVRGFPKTQLSVG